jgi:type I restriction enzyme R subunit
VAGSTVDTQIAELARASSNFGFLLPHLDLLVLYGATAENAIFADPNVAMYKARQFGEAMALDLVRRFHLTPSGKSFASYVHALGRAGVLVDDVGDAFHKVRDLGNQAVHEGYAEQRAALVAVETCFRLGAFLERLLTDSRELRTFVPPTPPTAEPPADVVALAEYEQLGAELARMQERLTASKLTYRNATSQLAAHQAAREAAELALAQVRAEHARLAEILASMQDVQSQGVEQALDSRPTAVLGAVERDAALGRAVQAAREPLTEAKVRERLDTMLEQAGWSVQDDNAATLNLRARSGVAVREKVTGKGRADYLLYVFYDDSPQLVGVVEAKREGEDVVAAQSQADRYATNLTAAQKMASWRRDELPFRYSSDAYRTLFRNTLDPDSRERRVFSFHKPETIQEWMRQADEDPQAPTLRAKMKWRVPDLDDAYVESLRAAQVRAVQGVERSHAEGRSRALVQMATGAGKTYAAVTFSYRMAKYAAAKRILFLVDRNSLGAQAKGEFDNYQIPGTNMMLPEEYNVQRLETGHEMRDSTKVVISTIQRLWRALTHQALGAVDQDEQVDESDDSPVGVQYNPAYPPETFDLIIVDECHRSIYGKWRQVLEYFDAPIVGLTATPVAQTYGYFRRNLVCEYSEDEAVADGVNVPFEVFRIKTRITDQGSTIEAGTVVPRVDPRTRHEKYEELETPFDYGATAVGKGVMSQDQQRLVIQTFHDRLYSEIFPERAKIDPSIRLVPKTLIFARSDLHADEIVEVVRDLFGKGADFCKKITYKADKAHDLINEFRTGAQLRVAVTVDMIATGTDVKPLECLMFLRDVRTWSTFQQYKGRGTRTVDRATLQAVTPGLDAKTRFVIVDAVGVTENPKLDACPMDRDPKGRKSLEKLLRAVAGYEASPDDISTLAARLAALNQQASDEERDELDKLARRPLSSIIHEMVDAVSVDAMEEIRRAAPDPEAARAAQWKHAQKSTEALAANPELRARILDIRRAIDVTIDEVSEDALLHAGGITPSQQDATVMVADFKQYVQDHVAEITAFDLAYRDPDTSPRQVLAQLREIARRIERPPMQWTSDRLYKAYEQLGVAAARPGATHGVADLLAIIQYELHREDGDATLRPYAEQVQGRFQAWLLRQRQAGATFTERQLWWLERIAESTARNVRFDDASLEEAPFTQRGKTDGFIRDFGSEDAAIQYLNELKRELTA